MTDLNLVARAGPAEPRLQRVHAAVQAQPERRSTATGVGRQQRHVRRRGGGLRSRTKRSSFSAGQFHYGSDGFRENNDLDNDIYTCSVRSRSPQAQPPGRISDPRQPAGRPGAALRSGRHRRFPPPHRSGYGPPRRPLFAVAQVRPDRLGDRRPTATRSFSTRRREVLVDDQGYQLETRYIYHDDAVGWTAGLGRYDLDVDERLEVFDPLFGGVTSRDYNREQTTGYAYFYPRNRPLRSHARFRLRRLRAAGLQARGGQPKGRLHLAGRAAGSRARRRLPDRQARAGDRSDDRADRGGRLQSAIRRYQRHRVDRYGLGSTSGPRRICTSAPKRRSAG